MLQKKINISMDQKQQKNQAIKKLQPWSPDFCIQKQLGVRDSVIAGDVESGLLCKAGVNLSCHEMRLVKTASPM